MFAVLEQFPMLFFAVLLVLGALLGQVRLAGATLGPAAVLFVALGLTAWGITQGVQLTVPEVLGTFGLILFTYTVGIISGPNFFGSLRRGWPVMLTTVGCLAVAAVVGGLAGRALGLPTPVIAGTFAGALTNTPALAAAGQAAADPQLPAVGYSISYLWGVVGMLLATAWALRRGVREPTTASPRLEQRTVRIDRDDRVTVGAVLRERAGAVTVTRVKHLTGPMVVASPDEPLGKGDLISVIGPGDDLDSVADELGHTSSVDIIGDRTDLDSNRVTLSVSRFAGHGIAGLGLGERFGGHVSRVRRGDIDMIPTADLVLQLGDRLRVVAPREQMSAIRAYLGDSERGFSDINPLGLALGLATGIGVGMIPVPLPTGTFTLGSAAGTLLAGLVFARIGRVGAVPISMSTAAAHALSALGMLVFLAYAGTKAGVLFVAAMSSSLGWKVALLGFAITVVAAAGLLIAGRLQRTDWIQLSGQLGGAQTQPALLAYANTRSGFDNRVSLGYVLVYPAAMVGKIVLAQLLVLLA